MRKYLISTLTIVVVAAAATAVPAFTADSGTVTATVTAQAPPAPCITLSRSTVDFGTLPFSDPAVSPTPLHTASPAVRVTSCSTAAENVFGAVSDAAIASGGSWDVTDRNDSNTCDVGLNSSKPGWNHPNISGRLYNPRPDGSFAPQPPLALAASAGADVTYWIQMPCRGSDGAGQTASMTFHLLAVTA